MACFSRHDELSKDEKEQLHVGQSSICEFCVHSCYVVELGQDVGRFEACFLLPDREQEVFDCSAFEHHAQSDSMKLEAKNEETICVRQD